HDLPNQEACSVRILSEERRELVHQRFELTFARRHGTEEIGQPGRPVREELEQDFFAKALLRREVIEKARLRDPDPFGDGLERDAGEALPREEARSGFEDLAPAIHGAVYLPFGR